MPTTTIQTGFTGTIRDFGPAQSTPTTTTGSNTGIGLSGKDSTGGLLVYAHYAIDLSSIPAGSTCNSAIFYLRPNATVTADRTYELYLLDPSNNDWVESQGTWNVKKTGTAWTGGANGGGVQGTDCGLNPLCTGFVANGAAADTDIPFTLPSATVQAFFGSTLYLVAKRQGTTTSATPTLRTSDTTTGTPAGANRPRLVVDYTAADPAVSGTATSRATDAVAFPQCTYTGDAGGTEVITVSRKVQGANDSTYVQIPTYYDRTNKIAYGGHSVDAGGGVKTYKGDIARTSGASYTYRFQFSGGGTTKTVDQTMLTRLDPLAHANRRKAPTIWGYNASDTVLASDLRKNSIIGMTHGDEGGHSADMSDVRGGQTDMPIMQFIGPEIDITSTDASHNPTGSAPNINWQRNSYIIDSTALTSFLASYSEDWFLHAGGSAYANRVYNSGYGKWILNWATAGLREWAYAAVLDILWAYHTDATSAATRFNTIHQDNLQGNNHIDGNWRSSTNAAPITPFETNVNTATTYANFQRSFVNLIKSTGTYVSTNNVNINVAEWAPNLLVQNGFFNESIFTSYSGSTGANYKSTTTWKSEIDAVISALAGGISHMMLYVQQGTAPSSTEVDFAFWSMFMCTNLFGAGGKVVVRPADNAAYSLDYITLYGSAVWDTDYGEPLAAYVQHTETGAPGSGNDRLYSRRTTLGTGWFNPSGSTLNGSAIGGPTLAPRSGAFVSSGTTATRTVPTTLAVSSVANTRTVPTTMSLAQTPFRTVPTTLAVSSVALTRTVPTSLAVSRDIPVIQPVSRVQKHRWSRIGRVRR